MGGSVGPTAGPTWLVIGDAAGSANPFVGAGIEYAYETGRIAGDVLDEALREHSATVLQRYPAVLAENYGTYFKIGRLFDRFAGRPAMMNRLSRTVTKRSSLAGHAVRAGHQRAATVARRSARARVSRRRRDQSRRARGA